MIKPELSIPINKLAFLQAYLYQIFFLEKHCENNFKHTEWYLKENFTQAEIQNILNLFSQLGLKCDCDLINKFDLRNFTNGKIKFHH